MDWLRRLAGQVSQGLQGPQLPSAATLPVAPVFCTRAAAISDVGLVRSNNEDRTLLALQPLPAGLSGGSGGDRVSVAALADGMGGHQAGEVASELALEAAQRALHAAAKLPAAQALTQALVAANAEVYAEAQRRIDRQGMGTTLVLLLLRDEGAHYAWLGDSRLYHLHQGQLRQLGEDDTVVRHLVKEGALTEAQALVHPDRNVLAQALGTHAQIPWLHVAGPVPIVAGDSFMLCSDGLHDVVTEPRIQELLCEGPAADCCRALIDEAKRCGSDDNISVAVVQILALDGAATQPRSLRATVAHEAGA